jgi:hypothetical protein
MSLKHTIRIKRQNPKAKLEVDNSPVWSLSAIGEELFMQMMEVKVAFCLMVGVSKEARLQDLRNLGRGVPRRLYEEQVRYKMYRISIFRPPPVFVIHLKHLDDRLKRELSTLDRENRDFVVREAIGKIFEHVDKRFYFQSAKPLLRWRFEN